VSAVQGRWIDPALGPIEPVQVSPDSGHGPPSFDRALWLKAVDLIFTYRTVSS
jgi:hypothetical protein